MYVHLIVKKYKIQKPPLAEYLTWKKYIYKIQSLHIDGFLNTIGSDFGYINNVIAQVGIHLAIARYTLYEGKRGQFKLKTPIWGLKSFVALFSMTLFVSFLPDI